MGEGGRNVYDLLNAWKLAMCTCCVGTLPKFAAAIARKVVSLQVGTSSFCSRNIIIHCNLYRSYKRVKS